MARQDDPRAAGAVVTNVSDLSPAMRAGLLEGAAPLQTAEALERRGLVSGVGDRGRSEGRLPFDLTDAGRRAAEALRALELRDRCTSRYGGEGTRCVLSVGAHRGDHVDARGRRWPVAGAPAVASDVDRAPVARQLDEYWVRVLVQRVGRELHDMDMLAADDRDGAGEPTEFQRGRAAAWRDAARYLSSSVRQAVERLGLADVLDAARAREDGGAR